MGKRTRFSFALSQGLMQTLYRPKDALDISLALNGLELLCSLRKMVREVRLDDTKVFSSG